MIQTTLIILTRNEIRGVKSIIPKIPLKIFDEYFAIDYQSTDGTIEYFKKKHIPIVNQYYPGRGEAFRIALNKARGKYIIFFSPDGNENPADLPLVIEYLKKSYDMVIASRFLEKARNEEDDNLFKFRAWAVQVFTRLVNLFWNGNLTDSNNGFRAINKDKFRALHLDAYGFAIEFQMTIRALKSGYKIFEFPTIEGNRIGGKSGSTSIPTGLRFSYYMIRELLLGNRFL